MVDVVLCCVDVVLRLVAVLNLVLQLCVENLL